MHDKTVTIKTFNNSKKNETIGIGINSSTVRYVDLPKNAVLTEAFISVGEKEVQTLSEYSFEEMRLEFERKLLKRDMFSYGYKDDDGKYSRIIYNIPINYLDGSEYKPIDTNIVPSSRGGYEVTKGIYKTFFTENSISERNLEVKIDNSYLILDLINSNYNNINEATAQINNNKIIYEDVFENIDLEYIYEYNKLKENFIIKEPISVDENILYLEFNFKVNSNFDIYVDNNLFTSGTIETDDKILFKNDDTELSFSKPFAYDAPENRWSLKYKLNKNQDRTIISILVPVDLLEKATYPLIVDPTIDINVAVYGSCDDDDSCFNNVIEIRSFVTENKRASVQFSLSSLPGYQTINEAKLRLTGTSIDVSNNCASGDDTDVYWENNDSQVPPQRWSDLSVSGSQLDRKCLRNLENIPVEWNVLGNGIDGFNQDYENGANESSFIIKFRTESLSTTRSIRFSAGAFLNVTYTVGYPPTLVGCKDGVTLMNSDGSDISVDLWECFIDPDNNASQAIFTIVNETNTTLIDCFVDINRYIKCGAPSQNKIGFSDINVSASDRANNDTDMIRISVKPPGDVSLIINNVSVWNNLNFVYDEVAISREISQFLEKCTADINGHCQVPINIAAHDYNVNFTINSLDINYDLREVEFSDALQGYMDKNCMSGSCEISLRFSSNTRGRLNMSDLQLFYIIRSDLLSNLTEIYQNVTLRVFRFIIKNVPGLTSDFNWELNTGENTIRNTNNILLNTSETAYIYVAYNYINTGNYSVNAIVHSGSYMDSEQINITI